jgi:hypothetical protein
MDVPDSPLPALPTTGATCDVGVIGAGITITLPRPMRAASIAMSIAKADLSSATPH